MRNMGNALLLRNARYRSNSSLSQTSQTNIPLPTRNRSARRKKKESNRRKSTSFLVRSSKNWYSDFKDSQHKLKVYKRYIDSNYLNQLDSRVFRGMTRNLIKNGSWLILPQNNKNRINSKISKYVNKTGNNGWEKCLKYYRKR